MKNMIHNNGRTFEEAVESAKKLSQTEDYKGCTVHVNTQVTMLSVKGDNGMRQFDLYFVVSDWYSDDSTVASVRNGEMK